MNTKKSLQWVKKLKKRFDWFITVLVAALYLYLTRSLPSAKTVEIVSYMGYMVIGVVDTSVDLLWSAIRHSCWFLSPKYRLPPGCDFSLLFSFTVLW